MGIATLAIAGIPPLAGFWSKDEILARAFDASWVYWLIGVITAFITSFYMFRLMYMTFGGDYRGGSAAHDVPHQSADALAMHDKHAKDDSVHGGHDSHGHGEPHESPWVMLGPLVILAILSLFGGFVGLGDRFEHFLDPVFKASIEPGLAESSREVANKTLEYTLMGISVTVAGLGWFLAWLFYSSKPQLPARIAESMGGLYKAVANKYYVDQIYAVLFVNPLIDGSTSILWHGIDQGVIDATVNGSAGAARHVSDELRHMQSGNLRSYAGWVAAGAAVVVAYMVWMGVR
jgi:NADH-quinone oxidoreductase subunit L